MRIALLLLLSGFLSPCVPTAVASQPPAESAPPPPLPIDPVILEGWRAVGGKVTFAEAYAPPDVPEEENAAILYEEAFAKINELPDDYNDYTGTPEIIDLLTRAAQKPKCRWSVDPGLPAVDVNLWWFNSKFLTATRKAVRILGHHADEALAQGNEEFAIRNLDASLALAHQLQSTPMALPLLVGVAIEDTSLQRIEEVLSNSPDADASLIRVRLAGGEGCVDVDQIMLCETALCLNILYGGRPYPPENEFKPFDPDLVLVKMTDAVTDFRQPFHTVDWSRYPDGANPKYGSTLTGMIAKLATVTAKRDAELRIARAAFDLRDIKARTGSYPDASTWAPPINPFTGSPMTYVREGEGFTLTAQPPDSVGIGESQIPAWHWPR